MSIKCLLTRLVRLRHNPNSLLPIAKVRQPQVIVPLLILIGIGIFLLLVAHYRRLSHEAMLTETLHKMQGLKLGVDSMEQANQDVKRGIDQLKWKVDQLKERLKSWNPNNGPSPQ